MKTKFNPILLSEELKKFKLLSEYTFITGDDEKPLILGDENIEEADEPPSDLEPEDSAEKIASDLDINNDNDSEDMGNMGDNQEDPNADLSNDLGGEEIGNGNEDPNADLGGEDMEMGEPQTDEVEVDVTSLVQGSKEAKQSADNASKNTEMLLQKLSDLESRVANMSAITNKIDGLEREIIKRNPTPVEKLEMRSLDSYPFNQKLTDYWADKEGPYDVMGKDKKEEYILTKDDVNHSFSDTSIKNSFNLKESMYEEENIQDFDEEEI